MNLKKINILIFIVGLCLCSCKKQDKDSRPNILWITTEDMSSQLGCFGDEHVHTPVIDQLASKGVRYTNAFATAPVCAPARSSIITGMHQSSIGAHHMRCKGHFPKDLKYLPQYLREAGYYCVNNEKEDYNLEYNALDIWNESGVKAHWKNREDKDQPFFAVFNFLGTHESATNSKKKHLSFTKDLPKEILLQAGEVPLPPYFPNTPVVNELMTRYYNNIAALDRYVDNILNELKQDGLDDNTIVIFYSDHGAGLPIHKRWLYDSGLKVPMIVKVPEKYKKLLPYKVGELTDELVSFTDLAPTVLELAGLTIPEHMQGRAFLGQHLSSKREFVYAARDRMDERYDMQRAVRDKQFKYIRYYEPQKPYIQFMNTPEKGDIMKAIRKGNKEGIIPPMAKRLMEQTKPLEELFDVKNDPWELKNLANDPNYKDVLVKMRKAHTEWSIDVADAGLIPEAILRQWESKFNKPIYNILREEKVPIDLIQEVALGSKVELFEKHILNANEVVRYWAATGIGNYAENLNEETFSSIIKLLDDECSLVRIAAARALCILNHETIAMNILKKELVSIDEWTRLSAALVLDEIGEKAKPVKETLRLALGDDNKYVARVVNHALNVLEGTNNIVK
ncbi:sulfatase-like hydrolase/transferase [Marinifilum caeruleilacunae]|nr:sulfatase-like hydrolase/transferase [Marinifilum caeruleilacunae]